MGGGDYKKSKIRNYIGNNFGLGANNFGGNIGSTIPGGNNYRLGTNKFGGNVEINFPQGRTLHVPIVGTSVPPPPPPPPDTDIECYVGNNFGLAGFDFAQPYTISSIPIYDKSGGEASDTPRSPSVPPPEIPPAYPTINPPQSPPGSDVDTYVGNNYGFGDGRYDINIGGSQTPPNPQPQPQPQPCRLNSQPQPCSPNPQPRPYRPNPQPKPETYQPAPPPQPCHTAGRSTFTLLGGGVRTSCPVCKDIWARSNSMENYQALLRGDHIDSWKAMI